MTDVHIGHHADRLASRGMVNVARRNLGWRMSWRGPWAPTRLVIGEKPAR